MIKIRLVGLMVLAGTSLLANPIDKANCTYKGIKLYGEVQVVKAFADIKIKEEAIANIDIKPVTALASQCGEWQFVDSFPDFTVQYNNFPDIIIKKVDAFPGVR